ncbi:hypothetical protein [Poseidonibacter ostreae]|uniref:Uncharacterized protein n=1 Tax=Poseidonibacter ostreae TaxID=2654171 RepID=A0A6L4WWN0_9BACT|nr:hypothetical protein [Poseidonibacter ostreae]KAB7891348.1 hypothetical protein GBG19_00500 [Poseidonibacter ostreae]
MYIPRRVVEELAKVDENLGYSVNISPNAVHYFDRNYRNEISIHYESYNFQKEKITTSNLRNIAKIWNEEKEVFLKSDELKKRTKEEKKIVIENYNQNLKELEDYLTYLDSNKMRKSKNLDDAFQLINIYLRRMLENSKNGWVFRKENGKDRHYPFVVTKITQHEDRHDGR